MALCQASGLASVALDLREDPGAQVAQGLASDTC